MPNHTQRKKEMSTRSYGITLTIYKAVISRGKADF